MHMWFGNRYRKVSKSISLSGQSHDAHLTSELDSYVELVQALSPSIDDLVSSLYPPVSLPAVQTQVQLLLWLFICVSIFGVNGSAMIFGHCR